MRNLKRALSLLLSSTMVLGMLVMGGSAAGYKDVDDSNVNQEAIEVLQTVGIMTGDQNGNFNPDGSITRNEMAVVMAHLLNLDYDYYRGTNPFTDVPEWAAPYVAACAAEGVVAGIGNGQYGGNQKVTAAEASLMIMKALGYFQNAEDFGTDWQVATIRQASYINLFANINSDADSALTRAQVAQLVLNGLKAKKVEFTGDKGIQIGDVTVGYRAEYTPLTSAAAKYNTIDVGTTNIAENDQYYIQLGEELYDGDLKLADNETDVFGRPAHTWSYDGEEIGTYVNYDLMVKEYTTAATGKELYEAIGKTAYDKYDFESYVNGKDNALYKEISKDNKKEVSNTADGTLTQVFVNSDKKEVVVTVINTYLAQATMDYNEKKDSVSFKIYGLNKSSETVSGEDFAIADISKDDFVLVTYANDEIQTISDVEILSNVEISTFSTSGGKVTAVTVDGTKYNDSAMLEYDEKVLEQYANSNLKDTTYNVYLDQYGYVIGVDIVEGVSNYVFITGVDLDDSNLATANFDANAIFLDGTSKVIEVKNTADVRSLNSPVVNSWFTYTKNSSDVYTLTAVESQNPILSDDDTKAAWAHSTKDDAAEIDSKHISLMGIGSDKRVYGNDETIYLLADLGMVNKTQGGQYVVIKGADEVVTGVDNASFDVYNNEEAWKAAKSEKDPAYSSNNDAKISDGTYALYNDKGYVIAAVVVGESGTNSEKIAYVNSNDLKDESYDKTTEKWTWTREVIINGEKVVLSEVGDDNESVLKSFDESKGRWVKVKYDAQGNVKGIDYLTADDNYVNDVQSAVNLIEQDKDTVVVQTSATHKYSLKGSTLYDDTDDKLGFRVASDVNVVLQQTVKNKETTEYYTGIDSLDSVLNDLNDGGKNYVFNAVIEDGRATSVIIVDNTKDGIIVPPAGEYKTNATVDQDKFTVTVKAMAGATDKTAVVVEALKDAGYSNITVGAGKATAMKDGVSYQFTVNTLTAYEIKYQLTGSDGWKISGTKYAANGDTIVVTVEHPSWNEGESRTLKVNSGLGLAGQSATVKADKNGSASAEFTVKDASYSTLDVTMGM